MFMKEISFRKFVFFPTIFWKIFKSITSFIMYFLLVLMKWFSGFLEEESPAQMDFDCISELWVCKNFLRDHCSRKEEYQHHILNLRQDLLVKYHTFEIGRGYSRIYLYRISMEKKIYAAVKVKKYKYLPLQIRPAIRSHRSKEDMFEKSELYNDLDED